MLSEQAVFARVPISGDVITYLVDEGYDARDAREVRPMMGILASSGCCFVWSSS